MRILLAFTFLIAFSTIAYAEDNKIIVIGEDGTVRSVDIGPSPVEPVKPKEKTVAPPRPVAADPAPVAAPVKPVTKPAPPKQALKKESPPKKKPPVKNAAAPKQKKAPTPAPKKPQKKQAVPAAPAAVPAPTAIASPSQRLGEQMTPDDAIRIALDVAPPSRSVNATPVNHNGIHAYQVVFKTEDGDKSVFVGRESGKIIK